MRSWLQCVGFAFWLGFYLVSMLGFGALAVSSATSGDYISAICAAIALPVTLGTFFHFTRRLLDS